MKLKKHNRYKLWNDKKISWKPTKPGGANFRRTEFKTTTNSEMFFKTSKVYVIFFLLFLTGGIILITSSFFDNKNQAILIIGGIVFLMTGIIPLLFDETEFRINKKGTIKYGSFFIKTLDTYNFEIVALQILKKNIQMKNIKLNIIMN